jgi:hypothetical protein
MSIRATSFVIALALALTPSGWARAQDAAKDAAAQDSSKDASKGKSEAACDHFAWPIAREKAWFAGKLRPAPSGERVAKSDEGILLALKPTESFDFFLAPERKPKPDSFSGDIVIFGVPTPGIYQVTLSDEAWIEVFENGVRLKSTAFTGQNDCPGVRKSVRFDLAPGAPVTIQISNSAKDSIKLAIAPAS